MQKYYKLAGEDRVRFEKDARHFIPKAEGGLMKRPKRKKHPQVREEGTGGRQESNAHIKVTPRAGRMERGTMKRPKRKMYS